MVLVAHGSRDPRAASATRALVRAVQAERPDAQVRASFLDHTRPGPGQVLRALEAAGHRGAAVVPLLLTAAYHGRVDIPGAITAARVAGLRMPVAVTDVLGPVGGVVDELLLAGLRRRLAETGAVPAETGAVPAETGAVPVDRGAASTGVGSAPGPVAPAADGIVLAAAGTRDEAARRTVDEAARALGELLDVPCLAAYASAAPPTAGAAVAELRERGARRVAVAAYFLAPGRLYETACASARAEGVVAVAAPLGAAPELARLVLARVAAEPAARYTRT
ncbi:CbiX/SirB N-terminal domain-containing protein [Micromonospora sp. NPDC049559]|uniref:sirohydrochlorin chelatase n=1 Tax=Micromonospora sp. NPDC049559 TaxID=3155923 RepID=UPI0034401264